MRGAGRWKAESVSLAFARAVNSAEESEYSDSLLFFSTFLHLAAGARFALSPVFPGGLRQTSQRRL